MTPKELLIRHVCRKESVKLRYRNCKFVFGFKIYSYDQLDEDKIHYIAHNSFRLLGNYLVLSTIPIRKIIVNDSGVDKEYTCALVSNTIRITLEGELI